ncbi:uncharacterized protein LOC113562258 [Ooceraea biroi]|uniref:uncharacterized protein LOC113562258 n=1 Tax=Ooceraea biroi TaxID=2015173 RepID=UPI000F09982B|nr:uncharacterized protein LOC113562258 [Ooceraea biroi]
MSLDALQLLRVSSKLEAIELNRLSLTLFGVWPKNNETKQNKLMSDIRVIILLTVILWICIIPSLHSLLKSCDDIMLTIDNLQITLPLLMAVMKLHNIWQKRYDVLPLLNMIKDDWLRPKTSEERNVMIKQAQIARILTLLGCCIVEISVTFVLQSFSMVLAGIMYTSTDTFMSLLIFHVCGHLENLKARIRNLGQFNDFPDALSANVKDHIRLLRSCIFRHIGNNKQQVL